MKHLFFLAMLLLTSCSKDDSATNKIFTLPPETQVGANTFGVTINGRVYIPRDSNSTSYNWWGGGLNKQALALWGGGIAPNEYTEINAFDGASTLGFELTIHHQNLLYAPGSYILKQSNFQDQADSILENHIFFRIYDSNINNYAYYGSVENQGFLIITRRNSGIISGTFNGKFVRLDNPNDFITITDGRFDINSFTIQNHRFP
jgi:hypothetical protein